MKKNYLWVIDRLFFNVAIIALLIALFNPLQNILPFFTVILAVLLIISLPIVAKGPKYYSIGMLILGGLLLYHDHADFPVWQEAINTNMNLLALFMFVPLLSLPVRYGGYTENINSVFRNLMGNKWKVHAFSSSLVGLLAPILTLGSISMLKDLAPQLNQEKTFIVALSRMFGLTLCWTPYFGTVIFMLTLLKVEWGDIVPFTLTFALVGMIVSILMEKLTKGPAQSESATAAEEPLEAAAVNPKKLVELVAIILFILISTLGVYYSSTFGMSTAICLVSIVVPFIWLAFLRKLDKMKESFAYYFHELLPKLKGEILLMISAGFFGFAFVNSSYSHVVPDFFNQLAGDHAFIFIFILSFIMIFIPVLGVHPFVMTSIFAATLTHGDIPISSLVLAFVILCSWGLALILSPFSTATLVIARDTMYSPFKVSVNWNFGYIGILFILLVVSAFSLDLLGF